jgi:hypothetical protein
MDLETWFSIGREPKDVLDHRPTRGHGYEALISITRAPVGYQRWHQTERIESQPASRLKRGDEIWQLL